MNNTSKYEQFYREALIRENKLQQENKDLRCLIDEQRDHIEEIEDERDSLQKVLDSHD